VNARQEWRNAVRDSTLDGTAKLVALVLDTYMDGDGETWPSKGTIGVGASCDASTVKRAVHRLEAAGFLLVIRSYGRRPNRYRACMPPSNGGAGAPVNGGAGAPVDRVNGGKSPFNGGAGAPRTRSTELERPGAGAYKPFEDQPPDITADPAIVAAAKAWLNP
jgi:hypothetical protein